MRRLISELIRRKVLRVAGVYLGVGWALIQVAGWLKGALSLPANFDNIVFAILAIGFVPVVIVTWMFDITIDGIKRTQPMTDATHHAPTAPDWVLTFVLAAVLAVTAAQSLWPRGAVPEAQEQAETKTITPPAVIVKAIAVLPFENMSPEKKDEFLVGGLTDEIRDLLGKQRVIRVISRQSSSAFKNRTVSVSEIAKQLAVTHILEGSVKREGDLFRIAAQLIDVATDSQIWQEDYETKLDRFFAIQDRIGIAIANALKIEFAYAAGERTAPTLNMQAYRLFLEAGERFRSREKGGIEEAIDKFKQAIALDPNYAEAHAGLASTYFSKASRLNVGYRQYWDLAEASAEKARGLKPVLGQPYAVLGALARGRLKWEEAFANGAKAVELDPYDSNARLWLGLTQFFAGQLGDAKRTLEEAQKNDPLYTFIRLWLARVAFARNDDVTGVALSDKLIESGADYRGFGYWYLAYLAQRRGDADDAEKNYRSAVTVWKTGESIVDRVVKALHGSEPRADTVAALIAEAARDQDFAPELELLLIGQDAAFIDALKTRLARGDTDGFKYFLSFLWRAPSAGGESFRELVRSAGLVDYWRKNGWPDKCRATEGDAFICE